MMDFPLAFFVQSVQEEEKILKPIDHGPRYYRYKPPDNRHIDRVLKLEDNYPFRHSACRAPNIGCYVPDI